MIFGDVLTTARLVANLMHVLGHGEWEVAIQDALGVMLKDLNRL
jgi:hypothetical protein